MAPKRKEPASARTKERTGEAASRTAAGSKANGEANGASTQSQPERNAPAEGGEASTGNAGVTEPGPSQQPMKAEEDEQVTIGIQGGADKEPVMYKVKPKVLLSKILEKYLTKVGGGPEMTLYKDGKKVNLKKSIGELGLKCNTVLQCFAPQIAG